MKTVMLCAVAVSLASCGGGSVSGPVPVERAAAPVAATVAPVAVSPAGPGWEGSVLPFAGWTVTNLSGIRQGYTAYYTSFDDQETALGSRYGEAQPGDTFEGSFHLTCVQVDVSQFGAGGLPLFYGFINTDGAVVKAGQIDFAKCRPTPSPEPSPSPTPTPGCFYNVPHNQDNDGKDTCLAAPGYISWQATNHLCEIEDPGVCSADFNLNPGQSSAACLKYTGGDKNCNGEPDSQEG